ncbi:aminotransferase class V-fold PLP-dependent enzyme [Serpentinicella sp. ANB-PHB4]|uniref:aminotransferase class V-fold PLP-dependent enzyme n=1 Tax=Serpentinicella sp. ANB-PHB4 TaxID=3074076 RepID=UPI002865E228|nr:aminotransferase class V-fold PLP-dependent enzyme [Serpentinicella sp. ANB-PHB4]MDR5658653.1 aminotransferase class V-fold PLP-dependent enzyme [Serpentinicella sp. ANB-PHB4]
MELLNYKSKYRDLVCGADTKIPLIDGRYTENINFDNAATTPPFNSVLKDIVEYAPLYSSIHRGMGYKSQLSSNLYEQSRYIISKFVNGDLNHKTIIFVKNTTDAINKLSYRLLEDYKDGVILSTTMEHHSNDLPWREKYKVDYVDVDQEGKLSLSDLEDKLKKYAGKVKLVAVAGASNVTGIINPIHKIAKLAHRYNAKILVDGAQLIPHAPVDMKPVTSDEHIDFLVFSSHKMYAPFGVGVIIGWKDIFEKGKPDYVGGGTVDIVTHDYIKWNSAPYRDEAGTPNIIGVIALISAIKTLSHIDMKSVHAYEDQLAQYAYKSMKKIPDILLYGTESFGETRLAIIPFNISGIHHETLASILSYEVGIAVRSGCFCAQPYVQKLLNLTDKDVKKYMSNKDAKRPGMVRLSFGLYNTYEEIDVLIKMLHKISSNKAHYIKKYS